MGQAAKDLRAATSECISRHILAYSDATVKPKHHWCYDIADQLERGGDVFLDCFVVERLHLRVRDIGNRIDAVGPNWEQAILAAILNVQKSCLRRGGLFAGLEGNTIPNLFPGALVGERLQDDSGQQIAVGDIVLRNNLLAGEVVACVHAHHTLFVVACLFRFSAKISEHSSEWDSTEEHQIWPASSLTLALARYLHRGKTVVVHM